jgi:chromate transport protein ChrA
MLVQIAGGVAAQLLVSLAGIVLMVAAAWLMTWYRSLPELVQVPQEAITAAE